MWKERRLPTNVDPLKSRLEDQEERTRLARVFEQGLGSTVGLRIAATSSPLRFRRLHAVDSGRWFLRSEQMFLIPGDSPIGYRLPLDSLPWVAPDDYPHLHEPDLHVDRPPLPPRQASLHGDRLEGGARRGRHGRGEPQIIEHRAAARGLGGRHRSDGDLCRAPSRPIARFHAARRRY